MGAQSFKAIVDGVEYDVQTHMGAINKAHRLSGANTLAAVISDDYGELLQGLITVAMQAAGCGITYEEVGALCSFDEYLLNSNRLTTALYTDIADQGSAVKNASKGPRKKGKKTSNPSTGAKSSSSDTDSSG